MTKLILCAAVIIISVLISCEVLAIKKNCLKACKEHAEKIESMISMVRYGQYDVFQICNECICNYKFSKELGSFKSQWVDYCNTISQIDEYDRNIILKLGEVLGSYDKDIQCERLERIRNELDRSYDKTRNKLENSQRIYYALGCFSGLLICIILI